MRKLLLTLFLAPIIWAQNTNKMDVQPGPDGKQGRIQFKGSGTTAPTAPTGSAVNIFQRNGKMLCKDASGSDCWGVTNAAGTDVPLANISGALVSVKDYGAVGNGVADDTTAITNAIAANPSIYFPCGSYKITSKISLSSNKTIQGCAPANHWRGDSGTKIVYYGTDRAIEIKPPNSTGYDTINILDMEINGDNATSTARGLVIDGSNSSAYVEGVYTSGLTIKNFPGYQLYGTGLIFMLSFHNSSFFNISRTSGEHVVYFGDNQYRSQVYFYDCFLAQYTVNKWAFWEELGTGTNFSGGTVAMAANLAFPLGAHGIRANGGLNVWGTSIEGLSGAYSSQTGIKYTGTNGGLISATIITSAIGIEIGDGTNKTAAAEGLTIAGNVGGNFGADVWIWDGGSRTATQIIQIGRADATPVVYNGRATVDGVYTDVLYFNMGGSGLNLGGMPLITTGTVSTGGLSPTTVTASQAITSADNITGWRLESTTGILRAPTTTPLLVDNNAQTQNKVNLIVRSWSSQTNPFLSLQDSSGVEKARWNIDGSLQIIGVTYANLPTPSNGQFVYCTDCQQANPCASGGSGAFARREAGAWNCAGSGGGGGGSYTFNSGTGTVASTVGTTITYNVDTATVPTFLTGATSIDFGSIAQNNCSTSTITVTGAVTGDAVAPGWPAALEAGLTGIMNVTAANTVTVTLCKITSGSVDPANNTFRATIVRSF
jgi:hypothetical protein